MTRDNGNNLICVGPLKVAEASKAGMSPSRSYCTNRENLCEIEYQHDLATQWVYLIFIVLIKILFPVPLKHSSFWPSADVKKT
jgi:hypothetical protein